MMFRPHYSDGHNERHWPSSYSELHKSLQWVTELYNIAAVSHSYSELQKLLHLVALIVRVSCVNCYSELH